MRGVGYLFPERGGRVKEISFLNEEADSPGRFPEIRKGDAQVFPG